jgi:hypothetical protein
MEDFVTYEIAVKLEDKGFPQHICDNAYITDNEYDNDKYLVGERWCIPFIPDYYNVIAAPTISQVLKWLREEKKLHVSIMTFMFKAGWCYEVIRLGDSPTLVDAHRNSYNTYEEAAIAGVNYCLENLI